MKGNDAFEIMDRKAVRVMEEMTGMKIERKEEEESRQKKSELEEINNPIKQQK